MELKYDTMDLEHGVRLIGRVKDILEDSPEDLRMGNPFLLILPYKLG